MKLLDLLSLMLITAICLVLTISFCHAEYVPTGNDKLCNDIGYLSTGCKESRMVEMKYTDPKIAEADAKTPKTIDNSKVINKTYVFNKSETKKEEDITITSFLSEE